MEKEHWGFFPIEEVRLANENPFCLNEGYTSPFKLRYGSESIEVVMGNCHFVSNIIVEGQTFDVLNLGGESVINVNLSDDLFKLNILFHDRENNLIVKIENNEIIHSSSVWDIERVGTTFKLRSQKAKFLLELRIEAPNRLIVSRAEIFCNDILFSVKKNGQVNVLYTRGMMQKQYDQIRVSDCIGGFLFDYN